jgi:ceramide glucosyltransferase
MVVFSLRYGLLLVALAPFVYYCLCLFSAVRTRLALRRALPADFTPPASILKPVRGVDRAALENFSSYCRQDYPEYEILFCVDEPSDPVVPVIHELMRKFPERSIRLLIGQEHLGLNSKIDKLVRLVQEARYDLLVTADSDVRVPPNYLRSVAAPFSDPQIGAVTTFFKSQVGGSLVASLEALGMIAEFWANGLVACLTEGGLKWGTGATMAVTRRHLVAVGGYQAFVNFHSDDFQLAQALISIGLRIEFASEPVVMVYPSQSLGNFLRHEVLWYVRLRRLRPKGHLGHILSQGLPWAVLAAAIAPSAAIAAAYLLSYAVLRFAVVLTVGEGVLRDRLTRRLVWLTPLRDALTFCVWLASFFRNRVNWRGRELIILKDGRLSLPDYS